ncbi:MAG: Flp pilus assembly complex ATPase component TadA [Candidatus Hydrogenedentes bacterium]|nr:Flp pilus assembly complex ATPase component TadA [Candidatus Hydrogenedentota bacterium]
MQRQRMTGDMLGRVLVKMEFCSEQDIVEALAVQAGMERVDITKVKIKEEILSQVSSDVARFYNIIPVREKDGVLIVAMADPLNIGLLDDLSQILGRPVQGAVSNPQDIQNSLKSNYAFETDSIQQNLQELVDKVGDAALTMEELGQQEIVGDVDNLILLAQEPEVIKIVNLVLLDAVHKRASDIHFEVYEDDFRIRLRVDGMLQEVVNPPKTQALALTSRVKIMSNMDIGERRLPQDSRIELKVGDSDIDIRVSTLPTLYGECVVMRILDRTAVKVDLEKVGLDDEQLKSIRTIIHKPNGIFLVTGPTGSGKTTTLYACVNELNDPGVKIITTEDPVELQFDQVIQVHVKEEIGLTFAACLRSILRQDPDIVMVGEIRDLETAQIAVEASLTGHIVLSTLHTNSAPESLTRLLDMGVEPFLITSSLAGVLAQRLVRILCRYCSQPYRPDAELMEELALPKHWRDDPNLVLYKPGKCPACDFKGYKGRVGLFELMTVDEKVCDLILNGAMVHELRRYARRHLGMRTLREEGLMRAVKGLTSAEEVLTHTDKFEEDE